MSKKFLHKLTIDLRSNITYFYVHLFTFFQYLQRKVANSIPDLKIPHIKFRNIFPNHVRDWEYFSFCYYGPLNSKIEMRWNRLETFSRYRLDIALKQTNKFETSLKLRENLNKWYTTFVHRLEKFKLPYGNPFYFLCWIYSREKNDGTIFNYTGGMRVRFAICWRGDWNKKFGYPRKFRIKKKSKETTC